MPPTNAPTTQGIPAPEAARAGPPVNARVSLEDIISWFVVASCTIAGFLAVVLLASTGYRGMDDETKTSHGKLVPLASHELAAARQEHNALVELAPLCLTESKGSIAALQIVHIDPIVFHDDAPANHVVSPDNAAGSAKMPGYLMAAVYLSHAIGEARVETATSVADNDQARQVFEWAIVLIGAGSTVLISLKSAISSAKSSVSFALSVLAIVSSALATSASSLNAFYAPRIEYEKSQHVLSSLQHLHANLVARLTLEAGVLGKDGASSVCQPVTPAKFRPLKSYSDQFQTIMASANVGGSGAQDETNDEPLNSVPDQTAPKNTDSTRTAQKQN